MAAQVSMPQGVGRDYSPLDGFRGELYDCFNARADALFELVDGLSQPVSVDGVAHLSLAPGARRGHGSAYAGLSQGRIDEDMLRDLLAVHRPTDWGLTFAIDTSTWPRPEAMCSPGRGYYHQAHAKARPVHGQPIVAGWNLSIVAAIAPDTSRWTAPADIRLRTVGDDATLVAADQIRALLPRVTHTRRDEPVDARHDEPLFVLDAGYHPAHLTRRLADTPAQIVVRIRDDRVFFTRAPQPAAGAPGRPRRHGTRFHCAHPASRPIPDTTHHENTTTYGRLDVQAWHHLHPERPGIRDSDDRPAIIECTVIRIAADYLPGHPHRRPHPIWLWWAGPPTTQPDLHRITHAYLHRFDIEHTIRFAKQTLGLTTPTIRTPEQAQRWAWLVMTAYTQLRLASAFTTDHRLPWQRPQTPHTYTPGRVRTGFGHLLPALHNPTNPPKTTTPGPGRPPGRKSTPAPRHPARKTSTVKPPKDSKPG